MNLLKLADTTKVIPIYMADSTNPIAGKPGLTLTVQLSKNGSAFANAVGAVTELAGGHYYLTPTSADSGTLGPLVVKATAAGAVDYASKYSVVAFDPYAATNLGLTNLDAAVSSRLAPGGNVNTTTIGGVTLIVPSGGSPTITIPSVISSYSGADTAGTTTLLSRVTGNVALATQIPANFTNATFSAAGIFSGTALQNAPSGGGGSDPWATALPGSYGAGTAGAILSGISTKTAQMNFDTVSATTLLKVDLFGIAGAPYNAQTSITVAGYATGQDPATLMSAAGYTTARAAKLDNLTGAVALATQIPANFTSATFASPGIFSGTALQNAPAGGGGGLTLAGTLTTPRAIDSVADAGITVNDALWSMVAFLGQMDNSNPASLIHKTPAGTVLRTKPVTLATPGSQVPVKTS